MSPDDPAGEPDADPPNLTPEQLAIVRRGRAFFKSLEGRPVGSEHMQKKMQSAVGDVPEGGDGTPPPGRRQGG